MQARQFVGEAIRPDTATFDTSRMVSGEPGLPAVFHWRKRTLKNEINAGFGHLNRWASWKIKEGDFMTNVAASLSAGARGLRAAGYQGDIGVHIDRSWVAFYTGLIENGYTDY